MCLILLNFSELTHVIKVTSFKIHKFISLCRTVIFCLERVCQWIHGYLDRQLKGEGAALFKIRAHAAFYAACHIPFYVVAARFSELSGNRKCKHMFSLTVYLAL